MFQTEQPTILYCRQCLSRLEANPERESDVWFIRCLTCGVKNLLAITIEILGWRRENSTDIGVSSRSSH
jgi:hypothetical protein